MSETKLNYRWERIERLFKELQYEIERGMIEGEQYRESHGNWVRIGYVIQVPIDERVDLRPFGQLRTWMGDPPNDEKNIL